MQGFVWSSETCPEDRVLLVIFQLLRGECPTTLSLCSILLERVNSAMHMLGPSLYI